MQGVRTATVQCSDGMPAFVAVPDAATKAPAVIVVHERYGLVKHTCDLAERFARDGLVAIAPDLYFRHPDQAALHRGDVGCDISDPDAEIALGRTIDALQAIPQADLSRLLDHGHLPDRAAAAGDRGVPPDRAGAGLVRRGSSRANGRSTPSIRVPLDDIIAAVDCPVLGMFGETDHLISLDDIRRFRDCLDRHGKSYSIHVYRDAPHGWLNDTMPGRYRRAQAEASWADQRAFLARVLAPGADRSTPDAAL
jgi:carboxymethylenebutenolidase